MCLTLLSILVNDDKRINIKIRDTLYHNVLDARGMEASVQINASLE